MRKAVIEVLAQRLHPLGWEASPQLGCGVWAPQGESQALNVSATQSWGQDPRLGRDSLGVGPGGQKAASALVVTATTTERAPMKSGLSRGAVSFQCWGAQSPSEGTERLLTTCGLPKDSLTARSIYRFFFSLRDLSVNEKLLSLSLCYWHRNGKYYPRTYMGIISHSGLHF